jgi:hypothetical protein
MSKNYLSRARSWAAKNKLLGPQAFLKYVIFTYLDALNEVSDEFVFKGGNLLWAYIRTPRATVDLDLSTIEEIDNAAVKAALSAAKSADGIQFRLEKFERINQKEKQGASVTISYKTDAGASNKFDIDIIYASPVDFEEIVSPSGSEIEIKAASIENIIADKLTAIQRFKSGNTRIKDFDDLWRISVSELAVNRKRLKAIMHERKIEYYIEKEWISREIDAAWRNHQRRYNDLPEDLGDLIAAVNGWLKSLMQ